MDSPTLRACVIAVALFLPSCGNTSKATNLGPANTEVTVVATGISFLDGTVTDQPEALPNAAPEVGINVNRSRGIFTFDILGINPDTEIVSATLRVYQLSTRGSPFAIFDGVSVDHIDSSNLKELAAVLFGGLTLALDIGVLSENPEAEYKTLDVTDAVKVDLLEQRGSSSFRLRPLFEPRVLPPGIHKITFVDSTDGILLGVPPVLEIVHKR